MSNVQPGSRSHLRALLLEALHAQREASRVAARRGAQCRAAGVKADDDRQYQQDMQRVEAIRRTVHWLETAIAFTPRPEVVAK